MKLSINGKADKINGFNYNEFTLLKDDQDIAKIELLKTGDKYGLHFNDLFDKYLAVRNIDLKSVAEKMEMDTTKIPNQIGEYSNIKNTVMFTTSELNKINDNYINVVSGDFSENRFSSVKEDELFLEKINGLDQILNPPRITEEEIGEILEDRNFRRK